MKPVILTFARYYLPGYRAGGPIRTIANMVAQLSNEFDFRIVTTDRDLGDSVRYPGVVTGRWLKVGNASVYYMGSSERSLWRIARLMADTPHDVQYLNSFFDPGFTVNPIVARYLGLAPKKPMVIAPRGEFSLGALALKRWKKRPYLAVINQLKILNDVTWQASSEREAADIMLALNGQRKIAKQSNVKIASDFAEGGSVSTNFPSGSTIHMAPNLSSGGGEILPANMWAPRLTGQPLRICFLSRISPMKNLDYALRVLAQVREPVRFSIYGPQEDAAYWLECLKLIDTLPANVSVEVCGSVVHQNVVSTLSQHDLFFLPTRGENFGHVIYEALRAGIPVLISDQTPWRQLEARAVGWAFPLSEPSAFVLAIEETARWGVERASSAAECASAYAKEISFSDDVRQANIKLFQNLLNKNVN